MAVLWAVVGLVLSLEVYFNLRITRPDISFGEVAAAQYARVLLWAIMAPLVLTLRRRVPVSSGRWVGGVAFHLGLSFTLMAGYYLARIAWVVGRAGEPWENFWTIAQASFFGRNLIDMVFYWGVLGFGYSFELYRRYKNEQIKAAQLESRLIETELKALKQQLHPHFLFNTMNTIAVLVREGRNAEAVSLLSKLSGLLRMSLDSARVQEVTLRQEMEFLDRYLEIQEMRFADRLTIERRLEPAALEARIPYLLLQPIVENAILHGIAGKNGPGRVEIEARVENGLLKLEVRDDGPGFEPAVTAPRREGIGLGNTRERLTKIYGNRSQLVLKSEKGRGTTVSILLPCRL